MKWKAWIAIAYIVSITFLNLTWGWAALFLLWTIPDIVSGRTYLFETVERKTHPITFWSIMIMWLAISGLMFIMYFYPDLIPTA